MTANSATSLKIDGFKKAVRESYVCEWVGFQIKWRMIERRVGRSQNHLCPASLLPVG